MQILGSFESVFFKNTYIYIYTAFSKIHLAVPACCAGIYTEHFSKGHRALHAFIDFKYPIQIYRFKSDKLKSVFIFQIQNMPMKCVISV